MFCQRLIVDYESPGKFNPDRCRHLFCKFAQGVAILSHHALGNLDFASEVRFIRRELNPCCGLGDVQLVTFSTRNFPSTSFGRTMPTEFPTVVTFTVAVIAAQSYYGYNLCYNQLRCSESTGECGTNTVGSAGKFKIGKGCHPPRGIAYRQRDSRVLEPLSKPDDQNSSLSQCAAVETHFPKRFFLKRIS